MPGLTGDSGLSGLSGLTGSYIDKVLGYDPIAYWPLNETSGAARCLVNPAQNGTYTGVTLGQTQTDSNGISFVCPLFDNATSFVNIYSAALNSAFNGAECTIMAWCKAYNAAYWSVAAYDRVMQLRVDADNELIIAKDGGNANYMYGYREGSTTSHFRNFSVGATLNWMHMAVTVSETADEVKVYWDASQQGATFNGLGNWAGNLSNTTTLIGAQATPLNVWYGWIAHSVVFTGVLTQPQIADLATL